MTRLKKMDPELKQKWVKALRGGGYRQTTGSLRHKNTPDARPKYCCLGVLANVCGEQWETDDYNDGGIIKETGDADRLSRPLLRKYGLSEAAQNHLIALNDGGIVESEKSWRTIAEYEAQSFRKIADWIDENL